MMRALVVDDDLEILDFVKEALHEVEGYEVDSESDPEAAWKLANENHYDLFVLDVYLKQGDMHARGLDLAKRIKGGRDDAQIILMTGRTFSRVLTEAVLRIGVSNLIGKPFSLRDFLEAVRRATGR